MVMGNRQTERQPALFIATDQLARSPGHPFYERLNSVLEDERFDAFVEDLCAGFYADKMGRPSLAPGVYFRSLMVGFFEGISSEREIAWRCADSRSLSSFLGYEPTEATPTREDRARVDKKRKKKGSNDDWTHPGDPDARIWLTRSNMQQTSTRPPSFR